MVFFFMFEVIGVFRERYYRGFILCNEYFYSLGDVIWFIVY